ncbi:RRPO polymerase, partial [Polyodon spathula]|nr:RRPO polymerase [Polyodon spathula]
PVNVDSTSLSEEHCFQLRELLKKHEHVFSKHGSDFEYTTAVTHRIPTDSTMSIKQRFCCDIRRQVTCKDAFPLPRVEESLDVLGKAMIFSTLDLISGYFQVAVAKDDQAKTAVTTAFGFFQCLLTTPSILSYPDFTQPFILSTDGSQRGLRAVLSQVQYGMKRVVAYASCGL